MGYNNNKNKTSKFKYYKYKILSKILSGKKGCKYKAKYRNLLLAEKINTYVQSSNNDFQNNSVLIITHDLTYSGAPLVLIPVIKYCQKCGNKITVISLKDGPLMDWYKKNNIDIFVFDDIFSQQETFLSLADNYNTIICNTVVTYPFVDLLQTQNKKVIWWIHEGASVDSDFVPVYKEINNIHSLEYVLRNSKGLYVVSPYSKNLLSKYNSNITVFPYGIKDFYDGDNKSYNNDKINIYCVGGVSYRKGQDLLCEAITQLPQEYRDKVVLNFVGEYDNEFAKLLIDKYKTEENINFKGEIYFEDKNEIYKDTDVLFCVSRDDPMPAVVTEAMILKIPALVTSSVGQYDYIEDCVNGFKISSENLEQLQEKIIWIINNKEKLKEIGEKGRQIYLKKFTIEIFEKKLKEILQN